MSAPSNSLSPLSSRLTMNAPTGKMASGRVGLGRGGGRCTRPARPYGCCARTPGAAADGAGATLSCLPPRRSPASAHHGSPSPAYGRGQGVRVPGTRGAGTGWSRRHRAAPFELAPSEARRQRPTPPVERDSRCQQRSALPAARRYFFVSRTTTRSSSGMLDFEIVSFGCGSPRLAWPVAFRKPSMPSRSPVAVSVL